MSTVIPDNILQGHTLGIPHHGLVPASIKYDNKDNKKDFKSKTNRPLANRPRRPPRKQVGTGPCCREVGVWNWSQGIPK